jgi:hypothetical protein
MLDARPIGQAAGQDTPRGVARAVHGQVQFAVPIQVPGQRSDAIPTPRKAPSVSPPSNRAAPLDASFGRDVTTQPTPTFHEAAVVPAGRGQSKPYPVARPIDDQVQLPIPIAVYDTLLLSN